MAVFAAYGGLHSQSLYMIALFACPKGTNTILQVDDPASITDEGTAYPVSFQPAEMDTGPATGQMRVRRIAQSVLLGAAATVKVTPVVDGAALEGQAETFTFSPVDGAMQMVELEPAAQGTRFGALFEVTVYNGDLEFGEADFVFHPRRGHTRGRS